VGLGSELSQSVGAPGGGSHIEGPVQGVAHHLQNLRLVVDAEDPRPRIMALAG